MSALALRNKIDGLETEMKKMEQVEIIPIHHFAEGLYAREITVPKGTLLTGKIHNFEHLNIISRGEISVLTEDGVKRIKAPCTLVSRPGTKRVGYAHEDTVWTTIHSVKENFDQDVEKLESFLVCETHEEFKAISEKLKIQGDECPM